MGRPDTQLLKRPCALYWILAANLGSHEAPTPSPSLSESHTQDSSLVCRDTPASCQGCGLANQMQGLTGAPKSPSSGWCSILMTPNSRLQTDWEMAQRGMCITSASSRLRWSYLSLSEPHTGQVLWLQVHMTPPGCCLDSVQNSLSCTAVALLPNLMVTQCKYLSCCSVAVMRH